MLVGTWHRYRRSACVEILHGKFSDCSSPPRSRTLTVSVIRQICTWLPLCINVWIDIVKRARCAIKRRFCVFFFSFSFFLFVWFLSLSSSLFLSVSGKYKVSNLPFVMFVILYLQSTLFTFLHDDSIVNHQVPSARRLNRVKYQMTRTVANEKVILIGDGRFDLNFMTSNG